MSKRIEEGELFALNTATTDKADGGRSLVSDFDRQLDARGFQYWVCGNVAGHSWRPEPWSKVSSEIRASYFGLAVNEQDPVLGVILKKRGLVNWQRFVVMNRAGCQEFAQWALQSGIVAGYSASFIGVRYQIEVVSVMSTHDVSLDVAGEIGLFSEISLFWHRLHDLEWVEAHPIKLTKRELEVLRWMREGKSYRDIATITGLTQRAIEFHGGNILIKLDSSDKTTAVLKAIRCGLIPL